VQAAIPAFKTSEISHLRRVVQFKYLPPHLQKQFYGSPEVTMIILPPQYYYLLLHPPLPHCPTPHPPRRALRVTAMLNVSV
jgi:tRNA-specific adenosine deaminase 3